jgi:hypothetical protein
MNRSTQLSHERDTCVLRRAASYSNRTIISLNRYDERGNLALADLQTLAFEWLSIETVQPVSGTYGRREATS